MKFYRHGVLLTCADVNLTTATLKERHDFWARLFDTNSKAMATMSLTGIAGSIPIDDIYSHDGDGHIMWQRHIKTTFVFAADDAFKYRYPTDDKEKGVCFERWVAMPHHSAFEALNLGDLLQTSIKAGGVWDQGRRRKAKRFEYEED